jgi:hypothetical protein
MAWPIATYCEKPQLLWLILVLGLMTILDGFTSTSLATLNSKPICPEQNYAASFCPNAPAARNSLRIDRTDVLWRLSHPADVQSPIDPSRVDAADSSARQLAPDVAHFNSSGIDRRRSPFV